MTNRVRQVVLDDAVPGMVLADAIRDAHGGVLLPSGTELTDATLQSLRRCGIDSILVLNDDIPEAELAAERAQIQQQLDRLFRRHADNEKNALLRQYLAEYRLGAAP